MKNRRVFALLFLSFFGSYFSFAADSYEILSYGYEYPSLQKAYPEVYYLQLPREKDFKREFSKLEFNFISNCGDAVFAAFYPKTNKEHLSLQGAQSKIEQIMRNYEDHFQNSSLPKSSITMIMKDTKLQLAKIVFQNHGLFLKKWETQINEMFVEEIFSRDNLF